MLCENTNCKLNHFNDHFSGMMGIFRKHLQSRKYTHPHLPINGIMQQPLQSSSSYHLHLADQDAFLLAQPYICTD